MESLYRKLHNKYNKLKTEKFSQFEGLNRRQEEKYLNFISVAEQLIEILKNENERLQTEVNDLRNEVASIRSKDEEQQATYQQLLMEENQKNTELLEEIQRLQRLQKEQNIAVTDNYENEHLNIPGGSSVGLDLSSGFSEATRKRRRASGSELGRKKQKGNSGLEIDRGILDESPTQATKEMAHELLEGDTSNNTVLEVHLPECCKRTAISGADATVTVPMSCLFQDLVEVLIGMKLSIMTQNDGTRILASHQFTGYSFSLTWIENSSGEAELMYQMLSLGMFATIAPDWMREVLSFRFGACPIFFERIARVIKQQF